MTATLFRKNKTHWLNILHAGWPAGLDARHAVLGLVLNRMTAAFPWINWQVRWGIVLAPMLLYGILMLGRRFPSSEAKVSGVSSRAMMGEVGLLGAAVVVAFLGLWLTGDIFPWLLRMVGMSASLSWLGWATAAVLWVCFGSYSQFRLGHWMLAAFPLRGARPGIGYVELGTDSWIVNITKTVLAKGELIGLKGVTWRLVAFVWTNLLMTALRFFAGPIVHKISPIGLLLGSAVVGTTGLWLLGLSATNTPLLWLAAASVTMPASAARPSTGPRCSA